MSLQASHDTIRDEMMLAFEQVYDGNWFVLGKQLAAFEEAYAAYSQVKFAIGISNGLDALFLALKSLDIGSGDEVIVPSNTFIATVLAVLHTGARPVFAEPHRDTFNIDPLKIAAAITVNTKAIIPVHLYGQACNMTEIAVLSERNSLHVIEDNAQAHGAAFRMIKTGAWGVVNATSFYPGKNLGALGDGGAITTNDENLAKKIISLRNYGSERKYYHEAAGYNMRLDELQAAMLSVKLKHLERWTAQRQEIAGWYSNGLRDVGDLLLPLNHPDATHVYHLYVIRTARRDDLGRYLQEHGIATMIHYPVPLHLQKALSSLKYREGDFPIAEGMARTCLSLPLWPGLAATDAEYIVETIKNFYA